MLKSISPGVKKSYVGYTNNIKLRLEKHNSNKGAKATKGYKWLLIYNKNIDLLQKSHIYLAICYQDWG